MSAMWSAARRGAPILRGLCAVAVLAGLAVSPTPASASARSVSGYLASIREDPARLRAFLLAMPKGGDLHNHLSGAVPTEFLIGIAARDGLCVSTVSFVASAPPCGAGQRPVAAAATDADLRRRIVQAWSMEGFVPGAETGHDHFFAAFGKFGAATGHKGDMLAEDAARAGAQNEFYLEAMLSRQSTAVRVLAQQVGFDADLSRMLTRLRQGGAMERIVSAAEADTDADLARFDALLRCHTAHPDPACDLSIRFVSQVGRTAPPEAVFAQAVLGFELAQRDPRYVGINLVSPEDDPVSLRDYRLHMRMVGYLRGVYPRAHVTLHAGELTAAFVSPENLGFHIRDAVETAGAERIGHGVDVAEEERRSPGLLSTMARRHVLVEINLTSNCQILVVCGRDHPLPLYRRSGVPVALSTDDEGIERTDLTSEYERAVRLYHLGYEDLRAMARAALDHGLLQGASLWRAPATSPPSGARPRDADGFSRTTRGRPPSGGRRWPSPPSSDATRLEPHPDARLGWGAMRALLVVNPKATATTQQARDLLVDRLGADVAITEVRTERRGHAVELARTAAERGLDVVIALGGDGTVNEVVNGLLTDGPDLALPRLAVVPCGFANVFARALGLPNRPVEAAEMVLRALNADRRRSVSVGVADERYFTFCAGMGFDAAVVRIVEGLRASGRRASGALYVRSAMRHYTTGGDRPRHAIEVQTADGRTLPKVRLAIVTNTSPWTYLGGLALTPTPLASFDCGLDLFGMTALDMVPLFRSVLRLLARSDRIADPRWTVSLHDLTEFAARAPHPLDFQLDGEYLGRRTEVRFRAVPGALQVAI